MVLRDCVLQLGAFSLAWHHVAGPHLTCKEL